MKLKIFLRGFGIGIVLTAIILSMLHTSEKNIMTNQEIIEQAKKLGMIDPKELGMAAAITSVPTDKITPVPTKEVVETAAPEIKPTSETKPQKKETSKPKGTKKPVEETDVVNLTVESGMWSEKICQKLQELGVIENATEFNKYLLENGYETKIRQGTYQIKKGASYEEIAKALLK